MTDHRYTAQDDIQQLSKALVEFNVSRRNISIYPRNHPIVERSLNRAFHCLQELFKVRDEITIAAAGDSLMTDHGPLTGQSTAYREIAGSFRQVNIARVKIMRGLTIDELYSFHSFLLVNVQEMSSDEIAESLKDRHLVHITVEFVNYRAFNLVEGEGQERSDKASLLEQYILAILQGEKPGAVVSEAVHATHAEKLAGLINEIPANNIREDSSDNLIMSYLQKPAERMFTANDLRRIMNFIDNLRPELKRQFLNSTVNTISGEPDLVKKSLEDMSAEEVISILSVINEQNILMPETLRNIMETFSGIHLTDSLIVSHGDEYIEDDIPLSSEVINLLRDDNFKSFVSDSYQTQLHHFIHKRTKLNEAKVIEKINRQLLDESVEKCFNEMILLLLQHPDYSIISQGDCTHFMNIIREQTDQFIATGMYNQILEIVEILESESVQNRYAEAVSELLPYYQSPDFFISLLISFRLMGREMREEVVHICRHFGEKIIPFLIEALIDESSQSVRKFIISLLTLFPVQSTLEAISRLDDERWFVKRNMLYIMNLCNCAELLRKARPLTTHENPKVSLEAMRCLLNAGDRSVVKKLKESLNSKSGDLVRGAMNLAGAFRVRELVPDLTRLLNKRVLSRADYELKIPAAKALAQIGDSHAIKELNNFLGSEPLLFRSSFKKLKEEVQNTQQRHSHEEKVEVTDSAESEDRK